MYNTRTSDCDCGLYASCASLPVLSQFFIPSWQDSKSAVHLTTDPSIIVLIEMMNVCDDDDDAFSLVQRSPRATPTFRRMPLHDCARSDLYQTNSKIDTRNSKS